MTGRKYIGRCDNGQAILNGHMSLKAKIEAVIYAAEEPVTLAQVAALFQAELLEERAARLKAVAAEVQASAVAEEPGLALETAAVLPEEAPAAASASGEPGELPEAAAESGERA